MAFGPDVTEDDPSLGQPSADGGGGSSPPAQPPLAGGPGPGMAAFARSRMGPQVSAPGLGNQADSMNKIIQAINLLKMAGLGLAPGDKLHADVYKTIERLSKHIGGAGAIGPAAGMQKTMLGDQMRDTIKQQLLARLIGQPKGQQGGQSAPMPSTPLPGA